MKRGQCYVFVLAALLIALAAWQLESARRGIEITETRVGTTPVSVYRQTGVEGPAVVIAHGFAGSRQLMEAFALTLARAGYVAVSFDFQGHGRNPKPMAGDIAKIEGTTARLVAETTAVVDAALALPEVTEQVAVLGHSMASDIVVRQAVGDERVAAVVAVSMYSEAVSADQPRRLLMISGAWEKRLREAALKALRLVDPQASEGETALSSTSGTRRRAAVAPMVEHVGVLYSRTSLTEALTWLDATFGRESQVEIPATGVWISVLLASVVALAWPLSALLPPGQARVEQPARGRFAVAILSAALVTPFVLYPFDGRLLPVLVADYLALHLFVYGLIVLCVLYGGGFRLHRVETVPLIALVFFGLGVFGLVLDRYAASFVPHEGRIPIILAIGVGAVPFMIADSLLTGAGRAGFARSVSARLAFLGSLGLAVALDFESLFFLLIILPVIVLFFLVFGLMGRWVARRTGDALATGLALGAILAWSLGVSFPLVAT